MPLSFDPFQGQRLLGFSSLYSIPNKIEEKSNLSLVNGGFPEPNSVLDALRSPSPLASHSSTTTTLSSSHGGGTSAASAAVTDYDKCGQINVDDLDGVLSDSQNQEQSIFKLIMDGVFDPGYGFGSGSGPGSVSTESSNLLLSSTFPFQEQFIEESPQIMNPEALINNNQCLLSSPPLKRFNSGSQPVFPFSDPDPFRRHQQPFQFPFQIPFQFHQQSPITTTTPPPQVSDFKSEIIDQLFNAAELIGTTDNNNNGDHIILAQGILARLNQHLNNINNNKALFCRAALHIVEVLNSLINDSSSQVFTPENLILRIAAYRSFSETSPFLQFINFTTNQTILESFNNGGEKEGLGFDRIHIIDFDVGYGGQWASLMQELAAKSKNKSKLSLKITAFASPPSSISDEFELRFTEENLKSFAEEVKIEFEIEILSLELLLNPAYWPLSLRSSEKEAIAVNLPISSVVSGYLPLILRFLKQISPNVVISHDRGCDRNEAPFPNAVINSLQYQITLMESLHATNQISGEETVENIEKFWIFPQIQNLLLKRYKWIERSAPWRSLFGQCGFSPASLSQTAEAQAECLLQRNSVKGFHVEKRQSLCSSLVLCWQRKELVSISAWR